ncbi:hypothetical protein MLD38_008985 [Melastoma candidum]|uniref:Uncharacterized protein n=1 Tax=Melastoma candidum TaxID=119954 RepID=A0ACB9S4M6_9MYRT|nr:hypothetical protein MLD38_008985 [Melastoma candidum]
MLMNGTSWLLPSACGGVAWLLSAMKAERIDVNPYSVRRALENTRVPVGGLLEDKLSTGQGLIQVHKAFEYIKMFEEYSKCPISTPTFRGIYLREATSCRQSTEWTIQVEPKVHEDAEN